MCDIRRYRTVVSQCVRSDLPPPSMFNRYIYYALLLTGIAQINVKLPLRCETSGLVVGKGPGASTRQEVGS